ATLSVEINAEGVDCLAVRYTAPVHGADYSQYKGRFFVRTVDIIEYEERWSGNNVISDYDPIAEFERELEGRPRTPQRLLPTTAAPPPRAAKGPVRGEIDRFGDADRALFPEIERLMKSQHLTSTEAVQQIPEDKLAGRGTLDSRIRRVSDRFRRKKL